MSTTITAPTLADDEPAPEVLSLRLLRRLHAVAPEFSLSLGLLIGWTKDAIEHRSACATAARQVDDPLEQSHQLILDVTRNDPPAQRRALLRAVARTHANTRALAARLELKVKE